ncbi:MAG: NIL domain-containing protein [Desertifilum sp.]|nr:NIL domain-containing protein [Desertifilum sp.]
MLASSHSEEHSDRRPTHQRICLRIPKEYHSEPVISRLTARHGLIVNINAALLGAKVPQEGWFDLDLQGTPEQIRGALIDLNDLDLEIWENSSEPNDGW